MNATTKCINNLIHSNDFANAIKDKIEPMVNDLNYMTVECRDMEIYIHIVYNNSLIKNLFLITDYDFSSYKLYDEDNNLYGEYSIKELINWALDLSTTNVTINNAINIKEVA